MPASVDECEAMDGRDARAIQADAVQQAKIWSAQLYIVDRYVYREYNCMYWKIVNAASKMVNFTSRTAGHTSTNVLRIKITAVEPVPTRVLPKFHAVPRGLSQSHQTVPFEARPYCS